MGETRVASRETHIVRKSTSRFGENSGLVLIVPVLNKIQLFKKV